MADQIEQENDHEQQIFDRRPDQYSRCVALQSILIAPYQNWGNQFDYQNLETGWQMMLPSVHIDGKFDQMGGIMLENYLS